MQSPITALKRANQFWRFEIIKKRDHLSVILYLAITRVQYQIKNSLQNQNTNSCALLIAE